MLRVSLGEAVCGGDSAVKKDLEVETPGWLREPGGQADLSPHQGQRSRT